MFGFWETPYFDLISMHFFSPNHPEQIYLLTVCYNIHYTQISLKPPLRNFMKFMKHSITPVPKTETPRIAANEVGADVLRNVSLLGKTQTVLVNAAPDIPETTLTWLKSLRYSPERLTEIPCNLDEYHVHWWLTLNNCVGENDELCPDGAPVGVIGARAVNITKGYIKNVTVA